MRRLLAVLLLSALPAQAEPERWAAYYTDAPADFLPYGLLVLDSEAHPPLAPLKTEGKKVLAYLSLVEIAPYRAYFPYVKQKGWLLSPGLIDVRRPGWAAYIVEELIPPLLRAGFNGLMLDTADTALVQEKRYPGMKEGLVALVRTIRLHYPQLALVLNRGFDALPDVAAEVDGVLAESIYSTVDKTTGKTRLQPEAHYRSVAGMLSGLRGQYPKLVVYTLDYWPEEDDAGVRAIYTAQRAAGFIPYVADPSLQHLREEPE